MREILKKLREEIGSDENSIQFKIDNNFYELDRTSKREWVLFTVFGTELSLNVNKLKGLDKEQVIEFLAKKFPTVQIY